MLLVIPLVLLVLLIIIVMLVLLRHQPVTSVTSIVGLLMELPLAHRFVIRAMRTLQNHLPSARQQIVLFVLQVTEGLVAPVVLLVRLGALFVVPEHTKQV
jgi:hypothetical protein